MNIVPVLDVFHFFRGPEKLEHIGVAFLAKHSDGEIQLDAVEEVVYEWLSFLEAIAKVEEYLLNKG